MRVEGGRTVGDTLVTLSAILPNYNHAALIPRALTALLSQARPPDEIIIVDDGSTDESLSVIEAWIQREPTIRCLVNQRNLGVIPALQRGLDAACGRFLYFAAADDWVMPGFFSLALDRLAGHPDCGFFCADAALIDGASGRPNGDRPTARPRYGQGPVSAARSAELLARIDNWVLTGSAVFRREAIIAAGGLDPRLGSLADSFLSRKIALMSGFYYAPEPVAVWCVFADSASRTSALCDAEAVLEQVPTVIEADPVFPAWYPDLFRRRWRFAVSRLALAQAPINRGLVARLGAETGFERSVLAAIWAVTPNAFGRVITLGLLWLRWRPTALSRVLSTALLRRLVKARPR
jgi:glycosyltransferase involved in cell wall biosynthesis